jgi:hypothetical protein
LDRLATDGDDKGTRRETRYKTAQSAARAENEMGTGGPTVITVHAGSRLRSPRRLGREKHQQREAGKRGQLTNRDRGAPARRRLGGAPNEPSAAQRGRTHGLPTIFRAIWF